MTQLEEIKARASAAAVGPWIARRGGDFQSIRLHTGSLWIDVVDGSGQIPPHGEWIDSPDIDFIEAARTDVPRLVAALEAVEEVLTWLDEIAASASDKRVATGSHVQAGGVAPLIRNAITGALEAA